MTLNLTLVQPGAAHQVADLQTTSLHSRLLDAADEPKQLMLCYFGWCGLLTYTGIAALERPSGTTRTSSWLEKALSHPPDGRQSVSDVLARLETEANRWFGPALRRDALPHTFTLAAISSERADLAVVSNHQDADGSLREPDTRLVTSVKETDDLPVLLVTGRSDAVKASTRKRLLRAARKRKPLEVQAALAGAIRAVADQGTNKTLGVSRHAIGASAWFDGNQVDGRARRYEMEVTESPFPILHMGQSQQVLHDHGQDIAGGPVDIVGASYAVKDESSIMAVVLRPRSTNHKTASS